MQQILKQTNLMEKQLYNCSETAEYLGISTQTLRRLRKRKEIQLLKLNKKYFTIKDIKTLRWHLTHGTDQS